MRFVVVPELPRRPIVLAPAVADPAVVHRLIDARAPYWPVQRYFANGAEYAALSGKSAADMIVAPVFRGSWAADGVVSDGVEPLLRHPAFIDPLRDPEFIRLLQQQYVRYPTGS